ncbi:MAG: NADH-quinone oxidoreductase subunit A [Dehalococcoidales bacterium]|nr:NADH-quinone oxidoreductase subunit A [Dehalococcoidales bacterium]
MWTDYSYIAILLICAILFVAITIGLPVILRKFRIVPHKPDALKTSTYECGMETLGKTWIQFNFRYYFYALIFLTMDVMVAFLYPWAIRLRQLGAPALVTILLFISIVVVGYIYAWKNKAFEWE